MKLVKNLIGKGPKKTEVSEEETAKRFEKIQQYVKKKEVGKDGMVTIEFACSEAKENFVTTVPLRDPNVGGSITDCVDDKTKKKMAKQTETSLKKNMVKTISGCFPPTMRRNANKALNTGLKSGFAALAKKISTSPAEKDKLEKLAVIRAWETEGRRNFVFDPQTKKFVAESARPDWMSDFKRHLKEHPMQEANETDVLQRVLVALASIDGEISPEEKEFLETFLTESIGSLQKRPVTDKDFSDIPDMKVKESLVMIAYALAWCDDWTWRKSVAQNVGAFPSYKFARVAHM